MDQWGHYTTRVHEMRMLLVLHLVKGYCLPRLYQRRGQLPVPIACVMLARPQAYQGWPRPDLFETWVGTLTDITTHSQHPVNRRPI